MSGVATPGAQNGSGNSEPGTTPSLPHPPTSRFASPPRPVTAPSPVPVAIGWAAQPTSPQAIKRPAPLLLTHPAYDSKNPPQRPMVTDLRLAPSQRSVSCYSLPFLEVHGRPASVNSPRSKTPRNVFIRSPNSPPGKGRCVPSEETRAMLDNSNLWKDRRWYSPGKSRTSTSPVHRVNTVITQAKTLSVVYSESLPAPARDGHFPVLSENQLRSTQQLSFEKGPGLPFKKRLQTWGL